MSFLNSPLGLPSLLQSPFGRQQGNALPPAAQQALQQYPLLQKLGLQFKMNPNSDGSNMLESWVPGEMGTKDRPRPGEFDPKKLGIEIFSDKTRPIDVLGDVVSHHLINEDPKISKTYEAFKSSITSKQEDILKDQYDYAKKNEGETRDYETWKDNTGLPAYFRGYAFQQWPQDFNQQAYTPQQMKLFDAMMQYLQGSK